jgi:hypothetical protein
LERRLGAGDGNTEEAAVIDGYHVLAGPRTENNADAHVLRLPCPDDTSRGSFLLVMG